MIFNYWIINNQTTCSCVSAHKITHQFRLNETKMTTHIVRPLSPSRVMGDENKEPTKYIYDRMTNTKYSVDKLLGKGAFAKCFEMTNMRMNIKCAVKTIDKSLLTPTNQRCVEAEINIHSKLGYHPHVVNFRRFFEDQKNIYITLELCGTDTLREVVSRQF